MLIFISLHNDFVRPLEDEESVTAESLIFLGFTLCSYVCANMTVPVARRRRKRESNPLELQLQMVANDHVSTGNRTQVFCKSSKHSSTTEPTH